MVDDKLTGR